MSTKKNDRVHLIENQVPVHKHRPRLDSKREKKDVRLDEHKSSKGQAACAVAPPVPPSTPVTTVVISSSSGVRVAQPPQQTHAVDKRTGRYLALGVTLVMIFITLYHTFLRQVPMLAGLVPPAVIMVLYLLWIVYFAKKRKRQVQIELV